MGRVLCSTIIEATKEICSVHIERKLAYFYFDFQRSHEQSIESLLERLLRQLVCDEVVIPPAVWKMYATNKQAGHRPGTRDLENTLLDTVTSIGKDFYIILDALDEIPVIGSMNKRAEILGFLERLARSAISNTHILVTSRDELDIRTSISPLSAGGISIQGPTLDLDIQRYIKSCILEDHRMRTLKDSVKDMIQTKLMEKACGM